jgi:hypothetical protein
MLSSSPLALKGRWSYSKAVFSRESSHMPELSYTNLFCICLKHYWLKPSMAINTCVLRNKRFLNIHIDVPPCWKVRTECFLYKSEHWQIWSLRIPYKHKETDVTNTTFHEDYTKNKISHNIHFFSWLRPLQQCFKSHLNSKIMYTICLPRLDGFNSSPMRSKNGRRLSLTSGCTG